MLLSCSVEKTLESPWDSKEVKPVNPKRNQPWILIGSTNAEAEVPIPWPSDVKSTLTGKDPNAGKEWRQEEKGTTEDEMVGWHHRLNGQVGDAQGGLACCGSWGHKESETTEWLNWTECCCEYTCRCLLVAVQHKFLIDTHIHMAYIFIFHAVRYVYIHL